MRTLSRGGKWVGSEPALDRRRNQRRVLAHMRPEPTDRYSRLPAFSASVSPRSHAWAQLGQSWPARDSCAPPHTVQRSSPTRIPRATEVDRNRQALGLGGGPGSAPNSRCWARRSRASAAPTAAGRSDASASSRRARASASARRASSGAAARTGTSWGATTPSARSTAARPAGLTSASGCAGRAVAMKGPAPAARRCGTPPMALTLVIRWRHRRGRRFAGSGR
jgi:hypothetical protein